VSVVPTSFQEKPAAVIPSLLVLSIMAPIASLGDFGQIASEVVYLKGVIAFASHKNDAECERCLTKALELRTWRSAPDARYSTMANKLAIFLDIQKRDAEAEYFYKKALQISDKTLGRHHAETSTILANLGRLYCRTGRMPEAEEVINQAMQIQLKEFGKDHLQTSHTLRAMGTLQDYKGEYSKAKEFYVQAFNIRKKWLEADDPRIASSSIDLARIYLYEKRPAEAEPLIKDALRSREKGIGHDDPLTAQALCCLGVTYDISERKAEAEKLYWEALRILKNAHEENSEYGVLLQKRLSIGRVTN
jgi:tetratricopeptide (TPR) repeat protein